MMHLSGLFDRAWRHRRGCRWHSSSAGGLSNPSRRTPSWSSSTVASIFWGSTVTVLVVSAIVGLICLVFFAFFEERNLRADREFSAAQEEA